MKKLILFAALMLILGQAFALQVILLNGRNYSGTMDSARDGLLTILDEKTSIIIPVSEVKMVLDGKTDITKEIMQKAAPSKIDSHYIQSDDYFVASEPLGKNEWIYVKIGKMLTPASPETKNQAKFFMIENGNEEWMPYWIKTQIATKANYVQGTLVVVFNDNSREDVYMGPTDTQQARSGSWFLATITDTSEIFKGHVIVSGGYKIGLNNMRIIIRG